MKRLLSVMLLLALALPAACAEEVYPAEEEVLSVEALIPVEAVESLPEALCAPEAVMIDEALEEAEPAAGTWGSCPWEIGTDGVLTIHAGTGVGTHIEQPGWALQRGSVTAVVMREKVVLPANCSELFSYLTNCTRMDLSGANTAAVRDMSSMFAYCESLTTLDLSGFSTAGVTDMRGMFYGCRGLKSLNLVSFQTAQVTDMSMMFMDCASLEDLGLGSFRAWSVRSMHAMFYHCASLTQLDLSAFGAEEVTDLSWLFAYCSSLTDLDLSGITTGRVTDMAMMFDSCAELTTVRLGRGFSFKGSGGTVLATLPEGPWYASSSGIAYTAEEISASRGKIAEIYSRQPWDVLPAVTGLAGQPVDTNASRLTWNRAANADGYQLWRSDNGGSFRWVKNCTTTVVNNYSLKPGTDYQYRVRAYAGEGSGRVYGAWSETVSVQILGEINNFTVTGKDTNCAMLKWDRVDGCTGYQVFRTEEGSGEYAWVKNATTAQVANYSLKPGATYYYKVRAYIDLPDGKRAFGQYSAGVKVYIQPQTVIQKLIGGSGRITFTWSRAEGASGYQIFYTEAGTGGTYAWWKNVPAGQLSITMPGLKANTDYWFKVRSYVDLPDGSRYYGQLSGARHAMTAK